MLGFWVFKRMVGLVARNRCIFGHFDATCQWVKGKLHFSFAVMMSTSYGCALFPPSAGDECKNHPSHNGTIALRVMDVPKMSVGAICFTSSVAVAGWFLCPPPFFWKRFFFHTRITPKKSFGWGRKRDLRHKVTRLMPKKKQGVMLICATELHFPRQKSNHSRTPQADLFAVDDPPMRPLHEPPMRSLCGPCAPPMQRRKDGALSASSMCR